MRPKILFILLSVVALLLFLLDLGTGSTPMTIGDIAGGLLGTADEPIVKIVRDIRLTKGLVAILAGIALSVSGLQMQTLFGNPLAGPYVLGVTSGASLGVAVLLLAAPGIAFASGMSQLGIAGAAWIGAVAVLALVAIVGTRIRDIMVILILGMMLSSGIGAVVQILQYLSTEQALKNFVIWTMGSLGEVTSTQMCLLLPSVLLGMVLAIATVKPLNLLLLGEQNALTMGLNLRRSRTLIFISTSLLAGTVTAFCGPIGFIGLAVPHVARAIFREADCRIMLPASALTGCCLMLACDILSRMFLLPINSITALVGIPIVIWIVLKRH